MALDPELIRHKEWLGFLQPVGLVVSPHALMAAQAVVNRNVVSLQQRLLDVISSEVEFSANARLTSFGRSVS